MKNSQLINSFWLAAAATVLVAHPSFAQVVQVTGVQLNSTAAGIEVILETTAGKQLQVLPQTNGNTYIVDIPNAQLRLPSGNTFRRDNPVEGIAAITVTNGDANSIRVTQSQCLYQLCARNCLSFANGGDHPSYLEIVIRRK